MKKNEILELLKDNNISRNSEKELVIEDGILYTSREWNMYSPNDDLTNAIAEKRVRVIVPCHL